MAQSSNFHATTTSQLGLGLLTLLTAVFFADAFSSVPSTAATTRRSAQSTSALHLQLQLPDWVTQTTDKTALANVKSNENGLDAEYPWCFTGRLWFRPALVRVKDSDNEALEANQIIPLNIFGYTIGGTVALEYDTSPVGPYREYVTMGALVLTPKSGILLGQWGSRLYVSTKIAEGICQQVWGVPAEVADIDFAEGSDNSDATSKLQVMAAPDPKAPTAATKQIQVTGWKQTRTSAPDATVRGNLPIWWTPTIKALWVKLLPVPVRNDDDKNNNNSLPLHKLRLSASSLRLHWCGQSPSSELGIPLPIGLSVDNVLIEISRQKGVMR